MSSPLSRSVLAVVRRESRYWWVVFLGVALFFPGCYFLFTSVGRPESVPTPSAVALLALLGAVLAYLGYTVVDGDLDAEHYPLVARHTVAGIAVLDLLTLVLVLYLASRSSNRCSRSD